MIISKIADGVKIAFYGMGRSSLALLQYLPLEKCRVTLRSDKKIPRSLIPGFVFPDRIFEGERATEMLDEDIIVFSPSVKRDRAEFLKAKERGCIFTSDCEIFFEENKGDIFAVTGSDGKSTTATLANLLLSQGGQSTLIGNIGIPMTPNVGKSERFVTELSSFMLEYTAPKSKRACLTSLSENHLDFHQTFENYKKTKISLLNSSDEFVIADSEDYIKGAFGITSVKQSFKELRSKYNAEVYLTVEDLHIAKNGKKLFPINEAKRRGILDLKNLLMAIALTEGYLDTEAILRVAKEFSGLEHRQELFLSQGGVDFYNSSIDTSPERTVSTLSSIGREAVVILGGRSKGLDPSPLFSALKKYARYAIICGENREEIYDAVKGATECIFPEDFSSAVRLGADLARECGALILSPASTSYDRFSDYESRGKEFKNIVRSYVK